MEEEIKMNIVITETLMYYDGPLLVVGVEQKRLFVCCAIKIPDRFICVELSPHELYQFKSSQSDLRGLMKGRKAYYGTLNFSTNTIEVDESSEEISNEDHLPSPGLTLTSKNYESYLHIQRWNLKNVDDAYWEYTLDLDVSIECVSPLSDSITLRFQTLFEAHDIIKYIANGFLPVTVLEYGAEHSIIQATGDDDRVHNVPNKYIKNCYKQGVGTALVLKNEQNQVLFGIRKSRYGNGCYGLPGGHVEIGETVREAAVRELKEETGLIAKQEDLILLEAQTYEHSGIQFTCVYFGLKKFEGEPQLLEPDKCEGWGWHDVNNLPHPRLKSTVADEVLQNL